MGPGPGDRRHVQAGEGAAKEQSARHYNTHARANMHAHAQKAAGAGPAEHEHGHQHNHGEKATSARMTWPGGRRHGGSRRGLALPGTGSLCLTLLRVGRRVSSALYMTEISVVAEPSPPVMNWPSLTSGVKRRAARCRRTSRQRMTLARTPSPFFFLPRFLLAVGGSPPFCAYQTFH